MISDTPPFLEVRENVPLAQFTSFGIGGPARYFMEAGGIVRLQEVLRFAAANGLRWCILGGGTNILVHDRGFDGLVIRMTACEVEISGEAVSAGAGSELMTVINAAASHGLSGMAPLAGIPGTLGGAVRGNAGAYGATVGELVETVVALDTGSIEMRTFGREECSFGYRSSMFKADPRMIVVSARLKLARDTVEEVSRKTAEILEKRAPLLHAEQSAGSFFMNPDVGEGAIVRKFEEEKGVLCRQCRIPAGWLIEQAGLRGKRIGGAMVSERHANYLINTGTATAEEVMTLARLVKAQVRDKLGVELKEEVNYIGF